MVGQLISKKTDEAVRCYVHKGHGSSFTKDMLTVIYVTRPIKPQKI